MSSKQPLDVIWSSSNLSYFLIISGRFENFGNHHPYRIISEYVVIENKKYPDQLLVEQRKLSKIYYQLYIDITSDDKLSSKKHNIIVN